MLFKIIWIEGIESVQIREQMLITDKANKIFKDNVIV